MAPAPAPNKTDAAMNMSLIHEIQQFGSPQSWMDYRKPIFDNNQTLFRIQGNYAGPPRISG
jgi:hypothetical protein